MLIALPVCLWERPKSEEAQTKLSPPFLPCYALILYVNRKPIISSAVPVLWINSRIQPPRMLTCTTLSAAINSHKGTSSSPKALSPVLFCFTSGALCLRFQMSESAWWLVHERSHITALITYNEGSRDDDVIILRLAMSKCTARKRKVEWWFMYLGQNSGKNHFKNVNDLRSFSITWDLFFRISFRLIVFSLGWFHKKKQQLCGGREKKETKGVIYRCALCYLWLTKRWFTNVSDSKLWSVRTAELGKYYH